MISFKLEKSDLKKSHEVKEGEILQLRIKSVYPLGVDVWRLECDDVTPLPGSEPTGYACNFCGIINEASEDGSLPDDWREIKFEEGSYFCCPECFGTPYCRICGCWQEQACETEDGPCTWVEPDLCSACADKVPDKARTAKESNP